MFIIEQGVSRCGMRLVVVWSIGYKLGVISLLVIVFVFVVYLEETVP